MAKNLSGMFIVNIGVACSSCPYIYIYKKSNRNINPFYPTLRYFNFPFILGTAGRVDKYDSSFQRSRSSSMSSLENITTETISCLTFADSYTKKSGT